MCACRNTVVHAVLAVVAASCLPKPHTPWPRAPKPRALRPRAPKTVTRLRVGGKGERSSFFCVCRPRRYACTSSTFRGGRRHSVGRLPIGVLDREARKFRKGVSAEPTDERRRAWVSIEYSDGSAWHYEAPYPRFKARPLSYRIDK